MFLIRVYPFLLGLPRWLNGKESTCQNRRCWFDPWVKKIPWRRKWPIHSSILAWKVPWTEEPDKLQSMGLPRGGHDLVTDHVCLYFTEVTIKKIIKSSHIFSLIIILVWGKFLEVGHGGPRPRIFPGTSGRQKQIPFTGTDVHPWLQRISTNIFSRTMNHM